MGALRLQKAKGDKFRWRNLQSDGKADEDDEAVQVKGALLKRTPQGLSLTCLCRRWAELLIAQGLFFALICWGIFGTMFDLMCKGKQVTSKVIFSWLVFAARMATSNMPWGNQLFLPVIFSWGKIYFILKCIVLKYECHAWCGNLITESIILWKALWRKGNFSLTEPRSFWQFIVYNWNLKTFIFEWLLTENQYLYPTWTRVFFVAYTFTSTS